MASDRITCREYDFTVKPFESGYKLIPACRSFLLRRVVDSDGENRSLKIQLGKIEESTIEYITAENGLNLFVGSFFDILRYKNDSPYNLHVRFLVSPDILESSSVVSTSGGGTVKIENAKDDDGNTIPLEVIEKNEKNTYWDFVTLSCSNNGNLLIPRYENDAGKDLIERYIICVNNVVDNVHLKIIFGKAFYIDNNKGLYIRQKINYNSGVTWTKHNYTSILSSNYISGIFFPVPNVSFIGGGLFSEVYMDYTAETGEVENGQLFFIL